MIKDPIIEQNLKEIRLAIQKSKQKHLRRAQIELHRHLCLDLRINYGATLKEIMFYLKRYHSATYSLDHITKTMRKWINQDQ